MNKEEILSDLIEEGIIVGGITVKGCDILLTTYYLNKLVEGGYIEMDKNQLTVKGFDASMELLERGWKLTFDETVNSITSVLESGESDWFICKMIIDCQELGLDGMEEAMGNV